MPTSKRISRRMRPGSPTACGSRWKPVWRDCRSRTRPAIAVQALLISISRSSGCARPARQSIRPAAIRCWSVAPKCFLRGQPDIEQTIAQTQSLRKRGRRLPVCAGNSHGGSYRCSRSPRWRRNRVNLLVGFDADLTVAQIAALGRAARQRRRRARTRGLGRIHARGPAHHRTRKVRWIRDAASGKELNAFFSP